MQPDSDGRSDQVLADICWENHLKRDLSLISSLFFGQFKSVLTCSCGYSSARFEPFNILAVPIPDDYIRVMTVHVILLNHSYALSVTVRIDKRSDLYSIIDAVNRLDLNDISDNNSTPNHLNHSNSVKSNNQSHKSLKLIKRNFIIVEIINSRVHAVFSLERKLELFRDGDNIFLYECQGVHRGMAHGVKSLQLPPQLENYYDYLSIHSNQNNENSNTMQNTKSTDSYSSMEKLGVPEQVSDKVSHIMRIFNDKFTFNKSVIT